MDEVRAAAAQERVLFRACDVCVAACAMWDRFTEAVGGREALGLFAFVGTPGKTLTGDDVGRVYRVFCGVCRGRRKVLTDEGKELIRLIPPEVLAELAVDREIPF